MNSDKLHDVWVLDALKQFAFVRETLEHVDLLLHSSVLVEQCVQLLGGAFLPVQIHFFDDGVRAVAQLPSILE